MFQRCNYELHHLSDSRHEKDKVPLELFQDEYGVVKYKRCVDCRRRARASKVKTIEKRKRKELSDDEVHCKSCGTAVKKVDIVNNINKCKSCKQNEQNQDKKRRVHHIDVLYKIMTDMDCCCNICRKIFIRTEHGRFIEREGTLSGLNIGKDEIEFANVKFKYLNGGNTRKGILSLRSYSAVSAESKKCEVICLLCNAKKKMLEFERIRATKNIDRVLNEKQEYVNSVKLAVGKCEVCGFF